MTDLNSLQGKYETLLLQFFAREEEKVLFEVSELGKEFVSSKLGPDTLLDIHSRCLKTIIKDLDPVSAGRRVIIANELLLNGIMAYAMSFYSVIDILEAEKKKLENEIAERKRAETEIIRLNEEVQNRALELEVKNTALEEANATKNKFFSIIAHDLKNPFAVIIGFSELLSHNAEKLTPDKVKDMSDNIHKSSKTAYELLENLLEWSRAQTGRLEFNPQSVKLSELVSQSVGLIEGLAMSKQITLTSQIADSCVRADANLLNTVLRNLLGNAIKFTPSGGKVKVDARELPEYAEIWVQDTGVGIPPEDLDKIFRIDVKYSTRGTADEPGTGLGLILCKEFIEKNGGKIWVESEPGKGTTVKFTLPKC